VAAPFWRLIDLLLRLSWLAFWRLQSSLRWSSGLVAKPMTPLILKRASVSRSPGQWRDDDYDVLEKGVVVSRIFKVWVAPPDRPVRQETVALRDFSPLRRLGVISRSYRIATASTASPPGAAITRTRRHSHFVPKHKTGLMHRSICSLAVLRLIPNSRTPPHSVSAKKSRINM
jgi:hypothetical protein